MLRKWPKIRRNIINYFSILIEKRKSLSNVTKTGKKEHHLILVSKIVLFDL